MRSHSRKGEEQTGREHQSILRRRRRIIFLLSYLVLSLLQCFFILYILYIFYTCFYYVLLYFYYTFIIFPIMFLLSLCSSLIFFLHFSSHFFHWQRTVTHNPWVRRLAGPSVSTTTVVSTQTSETFAVHGCQRSRHTSSSQMQILLSSRSWALLLTRSKEFSAPRCLSSSLSKR